MTPEQASKLRKGDTFDARFTVSGFSVDGKTAFTTNECVIPVSAVVSILPRPLEAGDRVRLPNPMFHQVGVLLAIDGEECWVRWDDGARNTQDLSDLQRVDDEDRKAKEG